MEQRFYKLGELAKMYKISTRTLRRRLEPLRNVLTTLGDGEDGEPIRMNQRIVLYSPKQVKRIFKFLGKPTTKD